ncbi:MAG: fused MFS/spermidine synthase [Elusimicrobia bacterium]|nr:fused MFS/spermidine synthase [Elusimicrobiota bacterium]
MSRYPRPWLAPLACGLSGASALAYELVWTRKLGLLIGADARSVGAVLGVFMGGLALGSWLGGSAADRSRAPMRLYGFVELGIACLGAVSLPVLDALIHSEALGFLPSGALLAMACAAILAPTALMGASLPALLRAAPGASGGAGRQIGWLYAANTLGAALGAALCTLALIEALGLKGVGLAASAANLAAAALALGLGRAPGEAPAAVSPSGRTDGRLIRAAPAIFALSGFLSLASEVLWTRYLLAVTGDSTIYSFGATLTAFLLGIVAGSALAARLCRRGGDTRLMLGGVLALAGACAAASLPVMGWLVASPPAAGAFWTTTAFKFLRCLAVLGPAATLSGMVFPLAATAFIVDGRHAGRDTGRLYAANALGAIAGSLAGGFVLLPMLGLRGGLAAVAAAYLLGGLYLLLGGAGGRPALGIAAAAALAAGAAGFAAARADPPRSWRVRPWQEVAFYEDGAESTVAVTRSMAGGDLTLWVDWAEQAGSGGRMQLHLRLLGHLPALFHPAPRRGLVVAFGSGMTAGSLAAHPFDSIDIVELSPGVMKAAPLFAPFNGDPLADPRVRLAVADGRRFLRSTAERYDVITTDPVNPETLGVGALYSREYYALVRSRLRAGGLACQWLPSHYDPPAYRMLVRTFLDAFPNASIWYADNTTVLLGFKDGPRLTAAGLRTKFDDPAVRSSLAAAGIDGPGALMPLLLAGPGEAARFAGEGPLNTDDRPLIELRSSRVEGGAAGRPETWEVLAGLRPGDPLAVLVDWPRQERRASAEGTAAMDRYFARRTRKRLMPSPGLPFEERARAMEEFGRRYLELTWSLLESPAPAVFRRMAGFGVGQQGRETALAAAARLDRQGRPEEALRVLLGMAPSMYELDPDLHPLPVYMADQVLAAMAARPAAAGRLGRALLALLPEGRNRPGPGQAGDPMRWRLWWSDARFHLYWGGGRFYWAD